MTDKMTDAFSRLWEMGYHSLIPVIPPGATISANSSLFKRIGTHQDARGKVPGIRGRDGKWFSFDWVPYSTDEADLTRWAAMNASTGIRTGLQPDGTTLIAIDADADNEDYARIIRDAVDRHLGIKLPLRVGRYPKALYLCRVSGPFQYTMFEFGPRDERGNAQRVEVLSDGRQFVAEGIHPKTGEPYTWPRALVPFDALPVFTPEQIDALMQDLLVLLPDAPAKLKKEGGASDVNQAALTGDAATIRRAVSATPNNSTHFPTRESYRDFGYAIKAALPDQPDEAFEIWADWCDRWEDEHGRTNDPDIYASDWSRMKAPFKRGASFVYEMAETTSAGAFSRADAWFQPAPKTEATIFDVMSQIERENPTETAIPPLVAGKVSWEDMEYLAPRQWLYGHKLLRKYVTFVAAPGGVGKTAWIIALALACASNQQLLHDAVRTGKPLRVWIFNLEDDMIEMRRRIKAAMQHFGLDPAVLDNIRLNSGRDRGIKIVKTGADGSFIATPDHEALVTNMTSEKIDLLIVDPFLRSHGVDENDNSAQDEVMRLFADIAERTDAAILLVHHTKKGAVAGDLDSMRGGSTQGGGARAAFTLSPMSAEEAGRVGVPEDMRRLYVRVDDAKNNMAPPIGRAEWLHLSSVGLGNGDAVYVGGDAVQVATAWSLPDAWDGVGEQETALLHALGAGMEDGERYSLRQQDGARWAGAVLMDRIGRTIEQAREILAAWEKEGRIEIRDYHSEKQRKKRKGLYVKIPPANSIFD